MAELSVYWQQRADGFGGCEVFRDRNPGNPGERFAPANHFQRDGVLPLIKPLLIGTEKKVLDYGCGTGRFTADLAQLIDGTAIGVDPHLPMINEATPSGNVRFIHTPDGRVPVSNRSTDLVFVSLVLGGFRGALLARAVDEISRVLKPNGLLVLVENTVEQFDTEHWVSRSVEAYQTLFPQLDLQHLQDYDEEGETLSIMAGRSVR